MADWPVNSIQNPAYGMGDDYFRAEIRSDYEGGYAQTRPRATRGISQFPPLEWPIMPEAQYQTLLTFAKSNMGGSFNWWHPVSSAQYLCRFTGEKIFSRPVSPGYRYVRAYLEEV
jgi:hypothetical protein